MLQRGTDGIPPLLVTVTTTTAIALYPDHPNIQVWVGQVTPAVATTFIQDHNIGAILDASHPFATEISQRAIALAQEHHLPYLRYERPATGMGKSWRDRSDREGLVLLHCWADLFQPQYLTPCDRTLLTVGTRQLAAFIPWHSQTTLFARVLPQPQALEAALAAGFLPERLVALRPPVSPEVETALWQQWQITQVVTKASGTAGGEPQKRDLAARLGLRLLVWARPSVQYPAQTQALETAGTFILTMGHLDAANGTTVR